MERQGSRFTDLHPHQQNRRTSVFKIDARVPLAILIVIGLVLGTANLSYGQSAPSPGRSEQGVLASEPLQGPTGPASGSEPQLDPDPDRRSSELLDEVAEKLVAVEHEDDEPEATPEATADTDLLSRITKADTADPGPVVHLTFDDGPDPRYTPAILDLLARYDAKATFFVLGSLAQAHPELLERIVAEGHTVANHTWNHEDLTTLTRAEFNESVGRTQAVLGPHATSCLRPPYGSFDSNTRDWAAELGLELVLWGTDTRDWQKPGVDAIADRIVEGAQHDSPILLHDAGGDRTQTIEALDRALSELANQGVSFEPTC